MGGSIDPLDSKTSALLPLAIGASSTALANKAIQAARTTRSGRRESGWRQTIQVQVRPARGRLRKSTLPFLHLHNHASCLSSSLHSRNKKNKKEKKLPPEPSFLGPGAREGREISIRPRLDVVLGYSDTCHDLELAWRASHRQALPGRFFP